MKKLFTLTLILLTVLAFGLTPQAHAQIVAYEGFNYPNGSALPTTTATGTGWSTASGQEGWRNAFDDSALSTGRYEVNTTLSINTPSGYEYTPSGGVVEGTFNTNPFFNAVAFRRTDATFDLGSSGTQYFSVLMRNNDTVGSSFGLMTTSKSSVFFFQERDNGTSRVDSDFGAATFPAISWSTDDDYLLVMRVVTDGAGGGNVDFLRYDDTETVPDTEPLVWTNIMTLSGLAGNDLGAVQFRIDGPATDTQLFDEVRLGATWNSVAVPEPTSAAMIMAAAGLLALRRRR